MSRLSRARKRWPAGVTFLEMMIVLSVLVVLAAITMEKFGGAIQTANENATRAKLGSLRSALGIYYTDMEGHYPSDLTPMLEPGSRYLTQMMPIYTGAHGKANSVTYVPARETNQDSGAWAYVNAQGADWGSVYVQCTHTDAKGSVWNQY